MKKTVLFFLFFVLLTTSFFAQEKKKKGNELYESLQLKLPVKKTSKPGGAVKPKSAPVRRIKVAYEAPSDSNQYIWYETFRDDKVLESIATALEQIFVLKKDLKISCKECGTVNAFYDSNEKELIICYELFVDMYEKMSKYHTDPDSLGSKIGKAFGFILYHEVGHAMIDILDIPLTGKEEDAADYFAFFMLSDNTSGDDFGNEVCIEGANFFKDMHEGLKADTVFQRLNAEGKIFDALPYWDEHSFDLQRYYSINSLLYGSDPDKWAGLDIGYRRHGNAINEYYKISYGWARLLLPHLRKTK